MKSTKFINPLDQEIKRLELAIKRTTSDKVRYRLTSMLEQTKAIKRNRPCAFGTLAFRSLEDRSNY